MGEDTKTHSPKEDIAKLPGSLVLDFDNPDNHHCPTTQPSSSTNLDHEIAMMEGGKKGLQENQILKAESAKYRVLRGWILLNEDITPRNFYFAWIYILYLGFILISFSTLEPQYINQVLDVPLEQMGKTTAVLYLIDYSVRLIFAMIFGPMIDYCGRKFVMAIGITLTSLGYFLMPLLSFSLFPGYVIGKCFLSCGVISLCMLPFAADYVDNSTKGVMAGINFGMGFVGGALAGVFIKVSLLCGLSYKMVYFIQAPMLLVLGFILRSGVKGGNTYYKVQDRNEGVVEIQDKALKWKEIKKAYREIPWVPISNIFGVLGNTDFYIMTTGLMIWLKSLLSPAEDPTLVATTYQVIFFCLSVVCTAIAASKIDKVSHLKIIFPILIAATLGFLIIPFTHNPKSWAVYLFFIIEGLSLPGVFVFSTFLSIRYNPPEIRGTLSGIGNGIGFLGAILILSLGGYLHDVWRTDASFVLYGALLLMTFVLVTSIALRMKMGKYSSMPKSNGMVEKKNDGIVMMEISSLGK